MAKAICLKFPSKHSNTYPRLRRREKLTIHAEYPQIGFYDWTAFISMLPWTVSVSALYTFSVSSGFAAATLVYRRNKNNVAKRGWRRKTPIAQLPPPSIASSTSSSPSLLVTVCNCAPFVIASESVQLFAKNGGEEPVGSEWPTNCNYPNEYTSLL